MELERKGTAHVPVYGKKKDKFPWTKVIVGGFVLLMIISAAGG